MAKNLGDAHDGDVFSTDDALLAGGFHGAAAEAGEGGFWQTLVEGMDELSAVSIAGGFAGGEEDARVGSSDYGFQCSSVDGVWSPRTFATKS